MAVIYMPASETMTVEQALQSALQQQDLQEVLIIGTDRDGELFVRSSRMVRKNALWLLEMAKSDTLNF